ncbi:MAG: xylulokinase [Acidimicrobiales bacterium]
MTDLPRGEQLVLAVDLGTGGPKVGFVSVTGKVAWQDHVTVETTWLGDGGAEQDADLWWRLICDTVRHAVADGAVPADQVVAAAITGQWASTVPVDDKGQPVADCVMWMDTRGGRHVRPVIGGRVAGYKAKNAFTWIRRTGAAPSPNGDDPIGHMLFLEHDCPDVASSARWFLEPVDYLSMRLSGVAAASPASMVAAWLTDNRHLDRLGYDEELLRLSGVDVAKLPPLHPTCSVVGTVLDDVASDLGLPSGVQVVTGTPDVHSAACGAGAVRDYETHMAISTTSWISAPVPFKKTDIAHSIVSIPGLTPDGYLMVNNQDSAGRCFEWLRDNVLGLDYAALLDLAAEAPPGSGGVVFTPWLKGERSPVDDRRARGGFHNLSLATDRAHLARAVLEGVAYNARWLHEFVEKFAKRRMDPIRLVGGGGVSDLWCQIYADVMDRSIERVADPLNAQLRGAAIFAGLALGVVRWDEVRDLVSIDAAFRPDPATRQAYDRLYAEFPKLYKSQKAMFARLNKRQRPA